MLRSTAHLGSDMMNRLLDVGYKGMVDEKRERYLVMRSMRMTMWPLILRLCVERFLLESFSSLLASTPRIKDRLSADTVLEIDGWEHSRYANPAHHREGE
jgi:hypothetical protein